MTFVLQSLLVCIVLCVAVQGALLDVHRLKQILSGLTPGMMSEGLGLEMLGWASDLIGFDQDGSVSREKLIGFMNTFKEDPLLEWDQRTESDWIAYVDEIVDNMVDSFEARKSSNDTDFKPYGTDPYPYFGFIPTVSGAVVPDSGKKITWEGTCFKENSGIATSTVDAEGNIDITLKITARKPTSVKCMDLYLLGTVEHLMIKSVFLRGSHTINWKVPANATEAQKFDVQTKGIRVMNFIHDPVQCIVDALETALLFLEPLVASRVDRMAAQRNRYFLTEYSTITPLTPRSQNTVEIDESLIDSGDFFGIIRMDGLDPMLAWAMGSTTGHTTIAIRDEAGDLFVAESTAKTSYWPVNGIQKTPFKQWIKQAKKASFNVVHAPLSPEYKAKFNATAALEFFDSVKGIDYGYQNMLWGWIDLLTDNYPCLPPNFDQCLRWDHIEVLFGYIDTLIPTLGDLMWNQAWNYRVNSKGLRTADIYMKAAQQGIAEGMLPTIVEQDDWIYSTTRDGKPAEGPSMVCNVFVCNMWKAAGIFDEIDSDINCAEFTNWDAYNVKIFDADRTGNNRPQACIDADPDNQLCQLTGKYSLQLNDYNSKEMYSHMAEKCPSLAPEYTRDPTC